MAKVELLCPKIFKWEGGFVDDPNDHGGATNMGVTVSTWRNVGHDKDGDGDIDTDDIRNLSMKDASFVLKKYYWDRWKADFIDNQSVAEILVDWVWCSGKWGIIIPQRILGVAADGFVGKKTLSAVNSANQKMFHSSIMQSRINFIYDIVSGDHSQGKFLRGWMNRLNDYKFIY